MAMSQTATLRGFVYNKTNGEPIIFTNVALEGTTYGVSTDVNGFYTLSNVKPGTYTLVVSFVGFEKFKESITLEGGRIQSKKIFLSPTSIQMDEFEVSAEKQEAKTKVKMSVVKVTPKEIKALPSIGGQADLAQYIQVLPGVVFTGDQGGQLYIRGGSPVQNKILLDGMIIYQPFHSIGLFSVFDTDIMRNADIYTGGFDASYGGRISSVMDITTMDGNKSRISGKIATSPFGSKLLVHGPLTKFDPKKGSSSFIFSGKTSYLEESSKLFYTYINEDGLPFNYTDLYGKLSFNGTNGSKMNLFGFNFEDNVRYLAISDLQWNNYGAGTNFVLVPAGSPVLVEGHANFSKYTISLLEEAITENALDKKRSSEVAGFNIGLDFKYFSGDNELKYGLEMNGFSTDYTFFNQYNRKIQQIENTTELAGYTSYTWNIGSWVINPSFRGHYYASLANMSWEPRIGVKYNINEFIRFKAAAGKYSQNLISANSDRDVVNLFYGFLSGPENLPSTFTDQNGETRDVEHKLQKANHYIAGFEFDVTDNLNINIEGYLKEFTQLTNTNRNKIFEEDDLERPEIFRTDYIIETGEAFGIDFVAKYTKKRLYLWAVYSLGKVNRWDGIQEYAPVFDRRHNANFVSTYTFGKNKDLEVSARWNLGSGFPFTGQVGFYEKVDLNDIGTDPATSNGQLETIYGEINGKRLPTYHRFDINVKKTLKLSEFKILELNLGVTNVYNRKNLFYFDAVQNQRVNQLPIMPSFGISYSF